MEVTIYAREKLDMAERALARLEAGTAYPEDSWRELEHYAECIVREASKWRRVHEEEGRKSG